MKGENFMLFFLCIILLLGIVVNHEITHGQIMKYYGCDNVSFGVTWKGAYTQCLEQEHKQSVTELLAHSQNEIIGYNIMPMFWLLGVLGLTILIKK